MTRAPIFLLIEPTIQNRPRYSSLAAWARALRSRNDRLCFQTAAGFLNMSAWQCLWLSALLGCLLVQTLPGDPLEYLPCGIDPTARTGGHSVRTSERFRI